MRGASAESLTALFISGGTGAETTICGMIGAEHGRMTEER